MDYFFIFRVNEKSIRESIFEQELERQINSTKSVSLHVGSDLRLVTSMLQDLADSLYIQNEMLSGDNVSNLLEEKFNQINSVTKVDSLLIIDNEGVITTHKASLGMKTFVNIDISSNHYMKQTMDSLSWNTTRIFRSSGNTNRSNISENKFGSFYRRYKDVLIDYWNYCCNNISGLFIKKMV
jgi:hypothetical protein